MIKRLTMTNFRLFDEADVIFPEDAQLILISGRNGSGKSTLLTAIVYGLYGEGPTGKRELDRLIRRGAELEGMEVRVEFTVGQDTYTVRRRRDNRKSSAILEVGGTAIMQGPDEVTAEVSKLLGMDAAGFRLAVFATQGELEGLSSLSAAERGKTMARLLRLDAVTKAKASAREELNSARRAALALGEAPDIAGLTGRLRTEQDALEGLRAAAADTDATIKKLERDLADGAQTEQEHGQAVRRYARAQGEADSAAAALARARQDLDALRPPPAPAYEGPPSAELGDRITTLERRIATAEEQARRAADAAAAHAQLRELRARLRDVEDTVARHGGVAAARARQDEAERELRAAEDAARQAGDALDASSAAVARLTGLRDRAAEDLRQVSALGGVCLTCAQPITPEHRDSCLTQAGDALRALTGELAEAERDQREAAGRHAAAIGAVEAARQAAGRARLARQECEAAHGERERLAGHAQAYERQLAALPEAPPGLEDLYAQRARLRERLERARAAEQAGQAAVRAAERRATMERALREAEAAAAQAAARLEQARVPQTLQEAMRERERAQAALAEERRTLTAIQEELAAVSERVGAARRAVQEGEKLRERRRALETQARVAQAAAQLLATVSQDVSARIRPALEGAVSALLEQMSGGRFSAVRVSDGYEVRVRDYDGSYVPLTRVFVSGGEKDLGALALRLGVASVIASQHGVGGLGVLILDEVFGFQDAVRREAILAGLRALRGVYPQMLVVSHVGGLEELADCVIDIELEEPDPGSAEVMPRSVVQMSA
ncbi:AAA family ATPase [Bailinhaonella thermotolerans]|uniref:Nuclease SbcCD subunit C n=1 Tax=Bailinhaonella thermotolerans TaxID=1070861 RepID=A0A3A4A1W9_9ACTN|nr:SMC family ATPase [Bailinhaonella thermotolerans]RJL21238.1 SMC family ATPase [Bailinhaonella thermotolerans]